jgi:predicted nucleic acid-binding protein
MTSRKPKRAYLDTNVLIEYAWERLVKEPPSRRTLANTLWERGLDGDFEIVVSTFCILELFEHFRDWFLMQKVIGDGFGFREFRRERKNHRLSKKEVEMLESLVADFNSDPNILLVEFDSVPKDFFSRVALLQENGVDFLDAFHILIALDVRATHFVTKDGEIRARFDRTTRRKITSTPMEMTTIRGFLKLMN